MRKYVIVMLALAALVAVGCGSGEPEVTEVTPPTAAESPTPEETEESPSPSPTPTEAEAADASESVSSYFAALVSGDVDQMATMHDYALEGSPANTYTAFQVGMARAQRGSGITLESGSSRDVGGDIEVCSGGSCSTYSGFEVSEGKLVSFTVDGTPIADRLAAGGATADSAGVSGTLVAAYHAISSGALITVMDVQNTNDTKVNLNIYSAEYVGDDGQQSTASDALGPIELRGGASATIATFFEGPTIGGTVYLPGSSENLEQSFEIPLSVK